MTPNISIFKFLSVNKFLFHELQKSLLPLAIHTHESPSPCRDAAMVFLFNLYIITVTISPWTSYAKNK